MSHEIEHLRVRVGRRRDHDLREHRRHASAGGFRATNDARGAEPHERAEAQLPVVVYVLALGTFLMGTTEFMAAGLLPELASDLGVSVARAGLSITVFAVGMIVGAPVMTMLTLRLPTRLTLILALGVIAVGHPLAAVASTFAVLLAARFLAALATGAFWAVANVLGLFGLGGNPGLISMAVRFAGRAPTLASALTVAAFNFGTAVGSWIAGLALDSQLGAVGPAAVGTAIVALTLIPATAVAVTSGRRPAAVAT